MNLSVLDSKTIPGGKIEIVQYPALAGSSDARTAEKMFFLREAKMMLKSVRITLNRGRCRLEPGAIYHMHGRLKMQSTTGGGLLRAIGRRMTTGEPFLLNEVEGSGEITLEPTYGHFILAEVSDGSAIICDKGMFFAGLGDLDVGVERNRGVGMAGGEGVFQTRIEGDGVVALFSPVPMDEIMGIDVTPDKPLMVDGNFALMRTDGVTFTLTKSSKTWLSTSFSGEGLFQTFTGLGTVWIAPTQRVYEQLATPEGLHILSLPPGSRDNKTRR